MIRAAGILFLNDDGEALFLKRGLGGDWPGAWCFPGGEQERDETAMETAERECREELGFCPKGHRSFWTRRISANASPIGTAGVHPVPDLGELVDYTTFLQRVPKSFKPKLNSEHTDWGWYSLDDAPKPLHPGAKVSVARFGMHELDVAKAMRDGELASPQPYENMILFKVRITGTGTSYRPKHDEFVVRKPEHYLTKDFLDRCNGLPVIWEHPEKGGLNSKEFTDRIVGTILLPYIKGDEVWGVAKIYDESAAKLMSSKQMSTSPAVIFRSGSGNKTMKLKNGSSVLIEGEAKVLDHLAICDEGVWDKGGDPTGVEIPSTL